MKYPILLLTCMLSGAVQAGSGLDGDFSSDLHADREAAGHWRHAGRDRKTAAAGRGALPGFQVTPYPQTWPEVEAKIGSRAKAGQVAGNFNTMIMLRVKELATAEMLTDQLPRVEVFTLMSVSGVDDSSDPTSGIDFKSRNEDRISVSEVPMLTPADLVRLPKGQAFALLEGGRLWKIRMPLPDDRGDPAMPTSLTAIANEMERTYITNEHWYRATETWWHAGADVDLPRAHVADDG